MGGVLERSILRVLIVEDYEPMRRFIATKLRTKQEVQIVSEVADGAEAVEKAQELHPDLILIDIGLPTIDGIEAARKIRKLCPESKILFVSENRSVDVVEEALRSGGLGYVVKSDAEKELLPAVDSVVNGKSFVSSSLAGHFLVATSLTAVQTSTLSCMLLLILGLGQSTHPSMWSAVSRSIRPAMRVARTDSIG
jgi:DNA-binding NarL/FixJ family response regulator